MLDECNLLSLNQVGGHFTWHRAAGQRGPMHKQLDRAVGDVEWRMCFPEAIVEVLPRRHSDHNPLLLHSRGFQQRHGVRPFRFEATWCTHEAYTEVVHTAWHRGHGSVAQALANVREDSVVFNKDIFGNIFTRKTILDRRLRGIEHSLERVDSLQLLHLYHQLLREYELTLFQEETLWFQKSRENWARLGNKNTRFFHIQTVIHWKKSHIYGLFLAPGEWCTDEDQLQTATVDFFKQIIGQSNGNIDLAITPGLPKFPSEAVTMIGGILSSEKVFTDLKSMASFKAPGPNGFQAIFYKTYWHIIGEKVVQVVQEVFMRGSFDPSLSNILITLIPKVEDPKRLTEFRPISLCNVIHKLISRVLVNRLRPWLQDILILNMLSSPSIFILWNGKQTPAFSLKRGLLQGDPISPYLFVLCMEKLRAMITQAVQHGEWGAFQVRQGGINISHLFFADDVLFFIQGKPAEFRHMISLLDRFALASGLSRAFASSGIPPSRRRKLSLISGIAFSNDIGPYLGFRLSVGRITNNMFSHVIGKVRDRLASWKGRFLNRAGRVTLANSVLASLPSYTMQVQWLPQHVCDTCEKMVRQFIWNGNMQRGLHLATWDVITQPHKFGGLGVCMARL
uniref:Retrovirus-related Pol polyprotein LINE-1 n=1 Tax=Cajanus cajan TaxID=3821 RepID=A0A151QR32_CAJCA|nr:Retrovirus-related Pol polyprotein LINE-1 [Cajanus cajan]